MKPLRIGCVKYLNARPLIHGWPSPVTFDHPAALCAQLANGDLDVALVSSFEFLRNPIYRIVDDVSISSAGPVYSVVLLLSPENQPQQHLQAMNIVFSNLQKDMFRKFLRQSATRQAIVELLDEADQGK